MSEPVDPNAPTLGMAHDPLVGHRTDALRFESRLGSGAMGSVYRARQLRLDRVVAVKVIAPHLAADPTYLDRFDREARTLAKLAHQNVVTCYDFGPIPGPDGKPLLTLVMEFVNGRSLAEMPGEGQSARSVLDLYRQCAEGLTAAHALGIVHRDIKPDNIMVTSTGVAKLADFGLAKPTESAGLTKTGSVLGSPAYMAPEVCKGEEPTAASDVYSLGCALYQSLCGTTPFTGNSPLEVIQLHITADAPRLSRTIPTLASLDTLLMRMLSKSPSNRPGAAEVAGQLSLARDRSAPDLRIKSALIAVQRERAELNTIDVPVGEGADGRHVSATAATMSITEAPAEAELPLPPPLPPEAPAASAPDEIAAAAAAPAVPDYLQVVPTAEDARRGLGAALPAGPPPAIEPAARPGRASQGRLRAGGDAPRAPGEPEKNVLHEAAARARTDQAKAMEERGDRLVAGGDLLGAAAAYDAAAQCVSGGIIRQTLSAKASSARARHGRRSLLRWSAIGAVLAALAVGAWLRFRPAPAPELTPTVMTAPTGQGHAAKRASLEDLRAALGDPGTDPHEVLSQAKALAERAPGNHELDEFTTTLAREVERVEAEVAAIAGLEHSDPAQALARAGRLRIACKDAHWVASRLPLPARIALDTAADEPLVIAVDGIALKDPTSLVFCRHASVATHVEVRMRGYQAAELDVNPDANAAEESFPVHLALGTDWMLNVPLKDTAAWLVAGDDAVLVDGGGVSVIHRGGTLRARLEAGQLGAHASQIVPPIEPLAAPLHLSTDDGTLWVIPYGHATLGQPRIVRHGQPAPSFCEQVFELRMGESGIVAGELGRDDQDARLVAGSPEKTFWIVPLGGKLAPWVHPVGGGIAVIDAASARLVDQEGQELDRLVLPTLRTAPVCFFASSSLAAVPTADGVRFVQLDGGHWRLIKSLTLPGGVSQVVAAHEDRLLVATDVSLACYAVHGATLEQSWQTALPDAVRSLGIDGEAATVVDTEGDVLLLASASGQRQRRVHPPSPPIGAVAVAWRELLIPMATGIAAVPLEPATPAR